MHRGLECELDSQSGVKYPDGEHEKEAPGRVR